MKETDLEETTRVQRWVRSAKPTLGWWPWGLFPLFGFLVILALSFIYFAPSRVEAQVESDTKQNLAGAGYDWAQVSADGQEVLITGTAPDEVTEAQVKSVARGTRCDTFAGSLACPTDVQVKLDRAEPAHPTPETVVQPTLPAVLPVFHPFHYHSEGDGIALQGKVPNPELKTSIGEQVAALGRYENVDNQLEVTGSQCTAEYLVAYSRAIALLPQLESGHAQWVDGAFSLTGYVAGANEAGVRQGYAADGLTLGELALTSADAADTCDQQFAALMAKSTLRFQTGSAKLAPRSGALLTKIANLARECEGVLRIEGHTDNVGDAVRNLNLSQSRAGSVKRALEGLGLDGSRLTIKGFGPDRPIAPNTTLNGRTKNRRIEIHVAR